MEGSFGYIESNLLLIGHVQYLWNNIQLADLFISESRNDMISATFDHNLPGHPVNKFVPSDVPIEKLALLGAATDW